LFLSPLDPAVSVSATATLSQTSKHDIVLNALPTSVDLSRPGSITSLAFDLTSGQNAQFRWNGATTGSGEPLLLIIYGPTGQPHVNPTPVSGDNVFNIPAPSQTGRYTAVVQTLQGTIGTPTFNLVDQSVNVVISDVTPSISLVGNPYTVNVSVTPIGSSEPTPTGSLLVTDIVNGSTCSIALPATSCTITPSETWAAQLYAQYSGDAHYGAAISGGRAHRIAAFATKPQIATVFAEPSQAGGSTFVGFNLPSAYGQTTPTGTVTISGGQNYCIFDPLGDSFNSGGCFVATPHAGVVSYVARYTGDHTYASAESEPVLHAVSSPGGPDALPAGTDICGFDASGTYTEQSGFVPVDQLAGLIPSMGVSASITGYGQLSIESVSPPAGASVNEHAVDVVGVFSGPANTGIVVNDVVGYTSGDVFLVPNVPLSDGANTLHLAARTLPGAAATQDIQISVSAQPSLTAIRAKRSTTFVDAPIEFEYEVGQLAGGASPQSVALSIENNGMYDYEQSGTSALTNAPTLVTYTSPGLHTAQLKITDTNGVVYNAYRTVLIQDHVRQRSMLCDIYGYLRQQLLVQDAQKASLAYQPLVRQHYLDLFSALGAGMPTAAHALGVVANGFFADGYAEIDLIRDNSDHTRSGFPLRITRGNDGVWRISEM
jgi:hypothetical protein